MDREKIDGQGFKRFLSANAEDLIFGGILTVGALVGAFLAGQVRVGSSVLVPSVTGSVLSGFLSSLFFLGIHLFLVFFCGTSAMGFLSPAVLLHFGFCVGNAAGTVGRSGADYLPYLLCGVPFILASTVLLLRLARAGFPLSLRFYAFACGRFSSDAPDCVRGFLKQSLVILFCCILLCFVYAALQQGIGLLLRN